MYPETASGFCFIHRTNSKETSKRRNGRNTRAYLTAAVNIEAPASPRAMAVDPNFERGSRGTHASPAYMIAVDDTLAGHPGLPSNPPNTPPPSWAHPETYCISEDIPDGTGLLAAVWQMADREAAQ